MSCWFKCTCWWRSNLHSLHISYFCRCSSFPDARFRHKFEGRCNGFTHHHHLQTLKDIISMESAEVCNYAQIEENPGRVPAWFYIALFWFFCISHLHDGCRPGVGGGGIPPPPQYFRWGGGGWPVLSSPQYFTVECHIIPTKYLKYQQ